MDSRDDTRTPPAGSQFYEGTIIGTAAAATDRLMVRIDAFGDAPFGDPDGVKWRPGVTPAYPVDGDWCLVAESEQGTWCVLLWTHP